MKKLIIIPTYNEAKNIKNLVDSLIVNNCDILVIDDASPDKTGEIVKSHYLYNNSLFLIERVGERGYASACKCGFEYGLKNKYDFIIQMDADLSHSSKDLQTMISHSSDFDMVIGSRYVVGGRTSGWGIIRILLSRTANIFSKNYLNVNINDLTSGFRIYNTKTLINLDFGSLRSEGYGFLVEILYRLNKNGISIKEVPIHFNDRKFGNSKMNISIVFEAIKLVLYLKRRTG